MRNGPIPGYGEPLFQALTRTPNPYPPSDSGYGWGTGGLRVLTNPYPAFQPHLPGVIYFRGTGIRVRERKVYIRTYLS